MTEEARYTAVRISRERAPIKWAVLDPAGEPVRTFGGDHAQTVAELYAEDATRDGLAAADRLRNARTGGMSS